MERDFLATELLSEIKSSSRRWFKVAIGELIVILLIVAGFLLYLNQYDFSSTQTIENTAEGVYALIDSEGNTIAWDITPDEAKQMMEVIQNG